MKKMLLVALAALCVVGIAQATHFRHRARVVVAPFVAPVYAPAVVAPVVAPVYAQPIVGAYTAPAVCAPAVVSPSAPAVVSPSVQAVTSPIIGAYTAPAVVAPVTAPAVAAVAAPVVQSYSYGGSLAVVGGGYSYGVGNVLAVRQRVVVGHAPVRAAVVVGSRGFRSRSVIVNTPAVRVRVR